MSYKKVNNISDYKCFTGTPPTRVYLTMEYLLVPCCIYSNVLPL